MFRIFVLLYVAPVTFSAAANTRIIGGYDASIEDLPHQVSLQNVYDHFCGGSIVKADYILTAAHCMLGQRDLQFHVRVGSTKRLQGGVVHKVKNFTICPGFCSDIFSCDAAIVQLLEPISFSISALPISLITAEERPRHGDMLLTSGWGMLAHYDRELPEVLQAVRVPTMDLSLCAAVYRNLKDSLQVIEHMFCAGGGLDKGSFKGDSGGPIINERRQLVGIVSWGRIGHTTGYPAVYTDVTSPYVRNFIVENTQ